MGFLAKLFGGGGRPAEGGDRDGIHVYVRCERCGEKIHARANRNTDISQEYADEGGRATPTLHKEILGSRCQNLMYVHLTFDSAFRIVSSTGERCKVISREEFEAE
ncbi:MAG TPA: hypothetical protein VN837_20660 [Chloroflexota bacterium]|nr:hypothetical protein [Chloroflexota bacterium]